MNGLNLPMPRILLIGKDGQAIARFEPKDEPEGPAITAAIGKALGY
jgi:glutathione peroxidase-family protein